MKKPPIPKKLAPTETPKPEKKPSTKAKSATKALAIEDACVMALEKLRALNLDTNLQAELQWCIGSYRYDGNPIGLFQMAKRAVAVFTVEKANKTKGITVKLISDLEKAIGSN